MIKLVNKKFQRFTYKDGNVQIWGKIILPITETQHSVFCVSCVVSVKHLLGFLNFFYLLVFRCMLWRFCGILVADIRGLISVSAWLIMVEYPSRAAIITALITPALNYISHSELCPAPTPQQSFMLTMYNCELSKSSIPATQHKGWCVIYRLYVY